MERNGGGNYCGKQQKLHNGALTIEGRHRTQNHAHGLLTMIKKSYHESLIDPHLNRTSRNVAAVYFWFTCITVIHGLVTLVIPHLFEAYSDTTRYYLKVFFWFLFVQITSNWACVKFCDPSYKPELYSQHVANSTNDAVSAGYQHNGFLMGHVTTDERSLQRSHNQNVKSRSDAVVVDLGSRNSCPTVDDNNRTQYSDDRVRLSLEWHMCTACRHNAPPRSHHCNVCGRCIVKRDHHCFLTGTCIGYRNQRHFLMLNFYMAVGCGISMALFVVHLRHTFATEWENETWWDSFLPVACCRWLQGYISLQRLVLVIDVYSMSWLTVLGATFTAWQTLIIVAGKTSFEMYSGVSVRSTATIRDNISSVFGPFWGLNFVFPAHIAYRQQGDGTIWKQLKPT